MSVIRVGSNGSYAEGWNGVFGKDKAGKAKAAGKKTAKKSGKKSAEKSAKQSTPTKKAAATKKAVKKKAGKKRYLGQPTSPIRGPGRRRSPRRR